MKLIVLLFFLIACVSSLEGDPVKFSDDPNYNDTYTFKLFDVYNDEMATYMNVRIGDSDTDKILLLDLSSYMTVIYENEPVVSGKKITYRGKTYDALIQSESVVTYGFHGDPDKEAPQVDELAVNFEIAHVNLDPETARTTLHDGVLGLALVQNTETLTYSYIHSMLKKAFFQSESYRFNKVYLNSTAEQYMSSITFGFESRPSSSQYLVTNNTLPTLPARDLLSGIVYRQVLLNVGLKEVDILNYFDVSEFEKNETVIVDSAVPYLQLPENTLKYFDDTFFSDNCYSTTVFEEASCGCVGSDYGGLPSIDFRFKDYLKYQLEPKDYMSPPVINTTTREPYCRLGIYDYWQKTYPANSGLGKIFINKFSLFIYVDRANNQLSIAFNRGESYKSLSLIVPTIIYYLFVITILSSLAIWLSIKKYKRLEEEKKKRQPLLQANNKMDGIKNVSKTLRKMDFNMNMSAYNKVFERQRANTLTN